MYAVLNKHGIRTAWDIEHETKNWSVKYRKRLARELVPNAMERLIWLPIVVTWLEQQSIS